MGSRIQASDRPHDWMNPRLQRSTPPPGVLPELRLGAAVLPVIEAPPVDRDGPPSQAIPWPRGAAILPGTRLRILLIEDDVDDARIVREGLASAGPERTEVLGAGSIRQALTVLGQEPVDAILLDLTLPDAEDLEGLSDLRDLANGIPIVVLASRRNEAAAARSLRRGAQDYVLKGRCDGEGLVRALRKAIERGRSERFLEYIARHDILTDLPNRTLLEDRLTRALEQARRDSRTMAILFLDLDRFKTVNDSLGHLAADRLLHGVAARLCSCVRASDTVARMGGDEFTILLPDIAHAEDVRVVAGKVLDSFRSPFSIDGREVTLSASLGAGVYPHDGTDAQTLLENADDAMYRAKRSGPGLFRWHDSSSAPWRGARESMTLALRRAMERDDLVLHYQPAIDALTGSILAVEALVRWRHPTAGLIPARRFVPLAEETGLIIEVGGWVLRHACARARNWQDAGLLPLRISVHVSYRQLNCGPEFVESVSSILRETGLPPERLELDVLEEAVARDDSTAVRTLRALHDLGIRISLDDYGLGPASLTRLTALPVATLKIAPRFIHHVAVNPDDAALVSATIAMAHSLRIGVLAKGVATAEQVAFLLRRQIDMMEGYQFSRPLPEKACTRLIRSGRLPSLGGWSAAR